MDERPGPRSGNRRTMSSAPSRSARRRSFGAGCRVACPARGSARTPLPPSRHPLEPRRSAQIGTRRAKVCRLPRRHGRARVEPYSWSGHRCEDVAPDQGVDQAHARSRGWPRIRRPRRARCAGCVRAHGMRAGRPAAPRWQPPIHRGAGQTHLSGSLRGSAALADVELVEGQLQDRVQGLGVRHTVPEQVGRAVAGRDRAVARPEVERDGESRVAVRSE